MKSIFKSIKIKTKILILVLLFVVSFAGLIAYSFQTISIVKVNGKIYKNIIQGKDVIADILPPPEYIIESYLLVLQMHETDNAEEIQDFIRRGKKLKEEYETRHKFWLQDLVEGEMKHILTVLSYNPAKKFYEVRDNEYIPAVLAGNKDKARNILSNTLKSLYNEHRKHIDRVVIMATERNMQDEAEAAKIIEKRSLTLIITTMVIIAILTLFSFFLIYNIAHSFKDMISKAKELSSKGADLTSKLKVSSKDEIGLFCESFNEFMDKLVVIIRELKDFSKEINDGTIILGETVDNSHQIIDNIIHNIGEINQDIKKQTDAVLNTSHAVLNLVDSVKVISTEVEQQSGAVEESSATIEEMVASINSIANTARNAGETSFNLLDVAKQGGQIINETIVSINEIEASSRQIENIIGVISDISEKTNLLAMNAAIEAAHAGDYGKGFSVVADEIRKLAENSQASAKETNTLLKNIIRKIKNTVELAHKAGNGLESILTDVDATYKVNLEITHAMEENSTGTKEIIKAINLLVKSTMDIAGAIKDQKTSNEQISVIIKNLEEISGNVTQLVQSAFDKSELMKSSFDRVKKVSVGNRKIAENLEQIISSFKI